MKISDQTSISMPMRNLISILAATAIGVWAYFGVIERLNNIETRQTLFEEDLVKGADQTPIDQEQFMLLEFLSKEQDKLKEKIEAEVPNIKKNDMTIQFHEERIIDLEEKNGTY